MVVCERCGRVLWETTKIDQHKATINGQQLKTHESHNVTLHPDNITFHYCGDCYRLILKLIPGKTLIPDEEEMFDCFVKFDKCYSPDEIKEKVERDSE